MQLIHAPVAEVSADFPAVALEVDRYTLAKRLWRGTAVDGAEFGFELERPLRHGECFWQGDAARYVIEQHPEAVLIVSLDGMPPSAAAAIGWAVGNLHLDFSSEPARLLAPDEPAARQLFARIQVEYFATTAVFRPGRFARGNRPTAAPAGATPAQPVTDDLGPSHKH